MNTFTKFVLIIILLIVFDFIWIGIINKQNYLNAIKSVQKSDAKIRYLPGLVVYIALAAIIIGWGLPLIKMDIKGEIKGLQMILSNVFPKAFILGALVYAVFDFTCMSIFSDWTLSLSIIDTLWGGVLSGIITSIIFAIE